MKTNLLLFFLVIFIVSLIITLNMFFQQSYQGEIGEQFNRQQLLIAKSVAKGIQDEVEHFQEETGALAILLTDRGPDKGNMKEFISNAFEELKEGEGVAIKVIDASGRLRYSTSGDPLTQLDHNLFEDSKKIETGKAEISDRLIEDRSIEMVSPMKNKGVFTGAVVANISIDELNKKFVVPIRSGIRGHAWMMDQSGTLLFHPTQPQMMGKNLFKADKSCFSCHKSFDVEKKILESGDVGFSSYIAPYGEDKLIAFSRAKIAGMSWIVCVSIPYSEVTFSIRSSMRLHSLLVIFIFLATLAGASAIVVINRQRAKAEERAEHLETRALLEKEIVETKDYLENILESTESKIMVLDRTMTVRTINSAHQKLCGKAREYVTGRSFFDVFPFSSEKEKSMLQGVLERCLEGEGHRLNNYSYPRGFDTLYLNISISPLVLHGVVEGIIVSSSDVTEEVNLKEVLRDYAARLEEVVKARTDELYSEKEKLNAIVETLEAGLFLVNDQKKVTWVNRTLREWLGKERIGEMHLESIYEGQHLHGALVTDKLTQEVIQHDFVNRKGFFQITSTPLIGPDGHVFTLVLVQDITEMKKIEERLMQSEKLSALARISAGVAHEIGNPLTSISSYVQILREMDHDDFTRESLDTIAKHINRITDIVRQMASFSRTKVSDLRPISLHELINMTLALIMYDKRMKHLKVIVDISDTLPRVVVNETQMIQVFMNIVLNAGDAMPDGGTIEITATQKDKEVEISFSDTGPGIDAEHIERIFDPFFTTKEKGTGLGLAVSYNIVKSFQGDIDVENRPGGGTTFRVRLPYYES